MIVDDVTYSKVLVSFGECVESFAGDKDCCAICEYAPIDDSCVLHRPFDKNKCRKELLIDTEKVLQYQFEKSYYLEKALLRLFMLANVATHKETYPIETYDDEISVSDRFDQNILDDMIESAYTNVEKALLHQVENKYEND